MWDNKCTEINILEGDGTWKHGNILRTQQREEGNNASSDNISLGVDKPLQKIIYKGKS